MPTDTKQSLVAFAVPMGTDEGGIPQVAVSYFVGPFVDDPAKFDPEQVVNVANTMGPLDPEAIGDAVTATLKALVKRGVNVDETVMVILASDEAPADNPQPPPPVVGGHGYEDDPDFGF